GRGGDARAAAAAGACGLGLREGVARKETGCRREDHEGCAEAHAENKPPRRRRKSSHQNHPMRLIPPIEAPIEAGMISSRRLTARLGSRCCAAFGGAKGPLVASSTMPVITPA